jgi:hypothetical protein
MSNKSMKAMRIDLEADFYSTPKKTVEDCPTSFNPEKVSNFDQENSGFTLSPSI